ncbi:MAG: PD40 domain-containing protein [Myxococcales bacterium]|nr:MAG: PD40 domain-containing protein [Myxococcales bacterium]
MHTLIGIVLLLWMYGCGRINYDELFVSVDAGNADSNTPDSDSATSDSGLGSCTWSDFSSPGQATLGTLNGTIHNYFPTLSADGLTMYLSCNRPAWTSPYRIYKSVRPDLQSDFGDPSFVNTTINGVDPERSLHPMLSFDGLRLYWASNRSGSQGFDLWFSERATTSVEFDSATNLGFTSAGDNEGSIFESRDGLRLYYSIELGPSTTGADLWLTTRASTNDSFSSAGSPIAELNTSDDDRDAVLSADELEIIFSSNRPGGLGANDLWVARRNSITEPFGPPENLTQLNSTGDEAGAELSADGTTLYFNYNGGLYFGFGADRKL